MEKQGELRLSLPEEEIFKTFKEVRKHLEFYISFKESYPGRSESQILPVKQLSLKAITIPNICFCSFKVYLDRFSFLILSIHSLQMNKQKLLLFAALLSYLQHCAFNHSNRPNENLKNVWLSARKILVGTIGHCSTKFTLD